MVLIAIAKQVWAEAKKENLSLIAAGVAFYAMLAVFPSLIAMVAVYALVADPATVAERVEPVTSVLPEEAATLLIEQLTRVAQTGGGGPVLGLVVSVLGALWAASNGTMALIKGINAMYGQPEERGFIKLKVMSLGLTLGAIVVVVLALLLVAVFPAVARTLDLAGVARAGAEVLRWLLLAAVIVGALSMFYRLGPCHRVGSHPRVVRGAVAALAVWLPASMLFSFYVSNFGSYNKTYGALAAVIILMLWLYLSAYAILLGAQVNAELEKGT